MGNLVFQATLGGQVNLVGPNTASTYNINVPTVNGTLVTTGDTGTVTNTMLAGSIANNKLTNSSVTIGSTTVALGATASTVAGLTLTNPTINGFTGDTSVINVGSGQFYKDSSGNVGIGTSSPGYRLDVNGIINGNNSIISRRASGSQPEFVLTQTGVASWSIYNPPSSTDLRFYNGSDLLTMTSAGNLGLGVTPSAWASGQGAMQFKLGGLSAWALGGVNGYIYSNAYYDGTNNRYVNNGTAASYAINNGTGIHAWFTAPSGTAGNAISFTQAMTLDASGRLGIGTTSPSQRLHVYQSGGANILLDNGGASTTYFATDGFASGVSSIYTNGSAPLAFGTNSTERARIDTSGNLLVGTTTASGRVTVKGATSDNSGFALHLQNSSGTELGKFRNDGLFYCSGVYNNPVGGTNRAVYVDSSGYLGYLSSVRAAKTNIAEYRNNGWLYQLNPVEFNYRKRDEQGNYTEEVDGDVQYGLIADDVATINERLCFYAENENGKSLAGIDYNKLIVPMLKAIQEQQTIIEQLKADVAALKGA